MKAIVNKMNKQIELDVRQLRDLGSRININYAFYYQRLKLSENVFFNENQKPMIKKLKSKGIETLGELSAEFRKKELPTVLFEVHQLYHSIPTYIRELMHIKTNPTLLSELHLPYKLNLWKKLSNISTKEIRQRLNEREKVDNNAYLIINRRHNLDITNALMTNPFKVINQISTEVKLQAIQYKLLHNIYPTMEHLYKWKIKETNLCSTCEEIEDLKHAIFSCPCAQATWNNLKNVVKENFKINLHTMNYETILLGYSSQKLNKVNYAQAIDTIMIMIKRSLILQRENKYILSPDRILNIIYYQMKLEYNSHENKTKIKRKWKPLVDANVTKNMEVFGQLA